ncbi:MAG: ribonuclease III [Clostridia bacterium]|nr:ribonuclease III [Clostridia bacterium]
MNEYPKNHELLEETIGYFFKDKTHLKTALTHSSYSNELKSKGVSEECNERMEFLGDSVLSLITTEYLFHHYPETAEGLLSKIRAATVSEKALGIFAEAISLGDYIFLGHGEDLSGGRTRISLLADAYEALLAAIYLDSGIDEVKKFLMPYITSRIDEVVEKDISTDFKTQLQQIVQQEHGEILHYEVVSEEGPPHDRTFTVKAYLNSNEIGVGKGHSKREAEQAAARSALTLFGEG